MTIDEYIKSKRKMDLMPFMAVYKTILVLIEDGIIDKGAFENVGEKQSKSHA